MVHKSLKDVVYDYILGELDAGRLRPGDRVHEREICAKLQTSRTPVREALLQLEPLGLVLILPRKGIVVRQLTLEDLRELFETLGALEAEAARRATSRLQEKDFAALERSVRTMEQLVDSRQSRAFDRENEAFHEIYLTRCNNRVMLETIRLLKRRFYDVPHPVYRLEAWEKQVLEEHREIVELLRRRDSEGVAALLQYRHWSWEHNEVYLFQSKSAEILA